MKPFQYGRRLIDPGQRLRRWIDPRLASLRIADVVAYLQARGWQQVPPDRPGYFVFQEPGTPPGEVPFCRFVPDSEQDRDSPQALFELLTGLAEFENRPAATILDDILNPPEAKEQVNGVTAHSDGTGRSTSLTDR
jgi:hypothetical protein